MAFNIADFQEALAEQGARPNLFEMTLTLPSITGLVNTNFTKLCKTAQLPGSTIGVVEVQYFGRPVKMPGNRTFENLTTTIINDEHFALRHSIYSTQSFFISSSTNSISTFFFKEVGFGLFVTTFIPIILASTTIRERVSGVKGKKTNLSFFDILLKNSCGAQGRMSSN